jgi:hypothetical protein
MMAKAKWADGPSDATEWPPATSFGVAGWRACPMLQNFKSPDTGQSFGSSFAVRGDPAAKCNESITRHNSQKSLGHPAS